MAKAEWVKGVLTLEDILESTLRVDIIDENEMDNFIKMGTSQVVGELQKKYNSNRSCKLEIDALEEDGIFISTHVVGKPKRSKSYGALHSATA